MNVSSPTWKGLFGSVVEVMGSAGMAPRAAVNVWIKEMSDDLWVEKGEKRGGTMRMGYDGMG